MSSKKEGDLVMSKFNLGSDGTCANCASSEKTTLRVVDMGGINNSRMFHLCAKCRTLYETRNIGIEALPGLSLEIALMQSSQS